jgi:3-methyladenine DNA glycosylase AlkD
MPATPSMTDIRDAMTDVADPSSARDMARYMRDRFDFLGVTSPRRRAAVADTITAARRWTATDLIDFAERCWAEPEREFQYVGADVLKSGHGSFRPTDLTSLKTLVSTKSWWDTVDVLATWPVGSIISRHPEAAATMDEWIDDADFWVARTAILHQLRSKDQTDVDRLFRYALRRAGDSEFFVRKAIGWSLRQYAHCDPDAIARFVAVHSDELSNLTRREATKNISNAS